MKKKLKNKNGLMLYKKGLMTEKKKKIKKIEKMIYNIRHKNI